MSRSTIPQKRGADAQEAAWVADEDRFVLQQAKKKAALRVKGGRAQPIDWLAVTLVVIDPARNPLDDEIDDADLDLIEPETVFDGLDAGELAEIGKGVDTYMTLESSRSNREYWLMMKTIIGDRQQQARADRPSARGVSSVAPDLDKLLGPKSIAELEKLEKQIHAKLSSNQPIDTDYWEHLLKSLLTYKARAKLRTLSQTVVEARMTALRKQQDTAAVDLGARIQAKIPAARTSDGDAEAEVQPTADGRDPEPLLRLRAEDKTLETVDIQQYTQRITDDRRKVLRAGYIPIRVRPDTLEGQSHRLPEPKRSRIDVDGLAPVVTSGITQFDREVARGLGDNEDIFTAEEVVDTKNKSQWAGQYRPRKPRYFNRVQTGYEWNKYNQTHYDHENPPPKVVQGYKFNVFYPDLVDKTKAPTYRMERENGRKRGQTFAPAGEDDTCLIRFVAGPPYEDIAFRIVDREWDYSAKRERGFRSSFDKGILQLHFQFKKIYYRK